jgi:hypothetical protein
MSEKPNERTYRGIVYWFNTEWPQQGKAVEDYGGWIDFPNELRHMTAKNMNDIDMDAYLRDAIDDYFRSREA